MDLSFAVYTLAFAHSNLHSKSETMISHSLGRPGSASRLYCLMPYWNLQSASRYSKRSQEISNHFVSLAGHSGSLYGSWAVHGRKDSKAVPWIEVSLQMIQVAKCACLR